MMDVTKISPEYTVPIPDRFRKLFAAGQEVVVTTDRQGRLIVTPLERIRQALETTSGMWADRTDIPADGVDYVAEVRSGQRLEDLGLTTDEAH